MKEVFHKFHLVKPSPKLKRLIILGVLSVVVAGLIFLVKTKINALQTPANRPQMGLAVETTSVYGGYISSRQSYSGTIVSGDEVVLSSKISGLIDSVNVSEGSRVTAGQIVAVLDQSELSSKIQTLEQRLQTARVNLDYLEHELANYELLWQEGAISEQQYLKIKFSRDTALSSLKEIEGLLNEARVNLSNTEIVSPINGVVTALSSKSGDLAMTGRPIMTVTDTGKLKARVQVPEGDLAHIRVGIKALVLPGGSGKQPVTLAVTKIFPALDPVTRSVVVEVALPHDAINAGYKPGMSAAVDLILEERAGALIIPKKALKTESDRSYVYLIEKNKAKKIQVETGIEDDEKVEIRKGLHKGDRVIVSGLNELFNGRKVFVYQEMGNDR